MRYSNIVGLSWLRKRIPFRICQKDTTLAMIACLIRVLSTATDLSSRSPLITRKVGPSSPSWCIHREIGKSLAICSHTRPTCLPNRESGRTQASRVHRRSFVISRKRRSPRCQITATWIRRRPSSGVRTPGTCRVSEATSS